MLITSTFLFVFILAAGQLWSQQAVQISFVSVYDGQEISIPHTDPENGLSINKLRFYLGTYPANSAGESGPAVEYHLVDMAETNTVNISVETDNNSRSVRLLLGTDSLANVSGLMDGPLDPINGMYWAWQSGYINFKLEGVSDKCSTFRHEYQYHIGGYTEPFTTCQKLQFELPENGKLKLGIDISRFMEIQTVLENCNMMRPGEEAAMISEALPDIFYPLQ